MWSLSIVVAVTNRYKRMLISFQGFLWAMIHLPWRIEKLFYLIVPILMPFLCSFRIASSGKRNGNNSELEEGYWLTLAICANLCVLGSYSRKR